MRLTVLGSRIWLGGALGIPGPLRIYCPMWQVLLLRWPSLHWSTTYTKNRESHIYAPVVADQYWLSEHRPHIVCCLMGYIVGLTIIMQAVFRISLQNSHRTVDVACVEQKMENFMNSRTKETIHADIRTFVQGVNPLGRDSIVHKIESLIYLNSTISIWIAYADKN